MNLGGFEQWVNIIVIIGFIVGLLAVVGAGVEGRWGTMVGLLAGLIGLLLFFQAIFG